MSSLPPPVTVHFDRKKDLVRIDLSTKIVTLTLNDASALCVGGGRRKFTIFDANGLKIGAIQSVGYNLLQISIPTNCEIYLLNIFQIRDILAGARFEEISNSDKFAEVQA